MKGSQNIAKPPPSFSVLVQAVTKFVRDSLKLPELPELPELPSTPDKPELPVPFNFGQGGGSIDRIECSALPIVRVFGWISAQALPPILLHTSNGRVISHLVFSRLRRPDVVAAGESTDLYSGFRLDFLLDAGERPQQLLFDGESVYSFPDDPLYSTIDPHYRAFFTQDKVMGRDAIYGSGLPMDTAVEYKDFAALASGRVLDFGCGNGDLVCHLRSLGVDAVGLELDEPRIRNLLKGEAAGHVVLYPGGSVLPFGDGEFDWVVSTEVIEHVTGIADYVPELARIIRAGGKLLVTVPDITAIPSSYATGFVPWHLLESTHINFYTPQSVTRLFASHFELQATYCLGASRVNSYYVPGSIGAIFIRRQAWGDPGRTSRGIACTGGDEGA